MILMNTKELTLMICIISILFISEIVILFKIYDRQTQILHRIDNIESYKQGDAHLYDHQPW